MRFFLLIFLFCFSVIAPIIAKADDNIINVYNWSNYIPDEVITQFEHETGIHINYSTYDSNETMYAKLKADPDAGYDIVMPSSYFIDRMRKQNMLIPLDKSKIKNLNNINSYLLNKPFDPRNEYSIPYLWGSTAITVNTAYYPAGTITRWADLWSPQYHDQLLMLDDTRDVFSMALITLGYSVNDTNPEHIKQAYEKLRALLPNIKLFNDEAEQSIYIDEDVTLGMGWNGDIYHANQENPKIQYVYPQEGFAIWVDNMAIPIGAKHVNNAYIFINFILRPDVAAKISEGVGYASPNTAAVKLMPLSLQNNPIVYPDAATMRRGQFQSDVGQTDELYEHYLELLKIGA